MGPVVPEEILAGMDSCSQTWKKWLAPSPFTVGCLTIFIALSLLLSFGGEKPRILTLLDNRLLDIMFHLRGPTPTSGEIVIVDIDNASLARVGQWPWPRTVVAELTDRLKEAGARVVGFDILFAEADRTSPKNHLRRLIELLNADVAPDRQAALLADPLLDHDLQLAESLARLPSVLGYVMETTTDGADPNQRPFPSSTIRLDPPATPLAAIDFLQARTAIVNIPAVASSESEGFFNVFPDPSGTVRAVPLFIALDAIPYPSLALEVFRIGRGIEEITVHLARHDRGKKGIVGITVGTTFIPTDEQGQLTVNYRGPVHTFPAVPAADVLEGRQLAGLRDKYVLIGSSAGGLLDLRATPFSNIIAGVEIQANVIDNLLGADPLRYDRYTEIGLTATVIVVAGLLLSALLAHASALTGGLAGILCLLTVSGGGYLFFLNNQIIGITYPLVSLVTLFLVVTLANFFFAGREKRFLRMAFSHYVSPEVVQEIIKNPAALSLSGQVRDLTIFFSDIRDFTTIAEKMTPAQLGRFMNRYLTAMSDVLLAHGGTVDKYIGDAIMAIWGAPLVDHDHAVRAVRAALASVRRLEELRRELESEGFPAITIGIGLNSGEVTVGNFGSSRRFDYTVIGDNVNLASRLEGLTKAYGCPILISAATRAALGERIFCRFIDRVRVKGKKLPVDIYQPLCEGTPEPETADRAALFAAAMEAYHQQHFARAEELLLSLGRMGDEKLSQLYLNRLALFRQSPPPPDWDGVFTFTAK